MSITSIITAPNEALEWKQASDDVFVATRAGEFAGYVAVQSENHTTFDNTGRELGTFTELGDARRALTAPLSARRGRLSSLMRGVRRRRMAS